MFEITVAASILAPRSKVWRDIVRFEAWEQWHTGLEPYAARGSGAGASRTVVLYDGRAVMEVLDTVDDAAHLLVYSAANVPVAGGSYVNTIRIDAVDQRSCEMRWSGRFNVDGAAAKSVSDYFYRFFQRGIDGLKLKHELFCLPPSAGINLFRLLSPSSLG
jgi:hypothetical protein